MLVVLRDHPQPTSHCVSDFGALFVLTLLTLMVNCGLHPHRGCWLPFPLSYLEGEGQWLLANNLSSREGPEWLIPAQSYGVAQEWTASRILLNSSHWNQGKRSWAFLGSCSLRGEQWVVTLLSLDVNRKQSSLAAGSYEEKNWRAK